MAVRKSRNLVCIVQEHHFLAGASMSPALEAEGLPTYGSEKYVGWGRSRKQARDNMALVEEHGDASLTPILVETTILEKGRRIRVID